MNTAHSFCCIPYAMILFTIYAVIYFLWGLWNNLSYRTMEQWSRYILNFIHKPMNYPIHPAAYDVQSVRQFFIQCFSRLFKQRATTGQENILWKYNLQRIIRPYISETPTITFFVGIINMPCTPQQKQHLLMCPPCLQFMGQGFSQLI